MPCSVRSHYAARSDHRPATVYPKRKDYRSFQAKPSAQKENPATKPDFRIHISVLNLLTRNQTVTTRSLDPITEVDRATLISKGANADTVIDAPRAKVGLLDIRLIPGKHAAKLGLNVGIAGPCLAQVCAETSPVQCSHHSRSERQWTAAEQDWAQEPPPGRFGVRTNGAWLLGCGAAGAS